MLSATDVMLYMLIVVNVEECWLLMKEVKWMC